jgi:hypothetical protein
MGGPPTLGELVDRFGAAIPLHHAARKWSTNRQRKDNPDLVLPPAYRMRFYTLSQELHWLRCGFDPPGRKTYQTTVLVNASKCPQCGEMFVAQKNRPHGTLCPASIKR